MPAATAAQFGFTPRSGAPGLGDGNGILEGVNTGGGNIGICLGAGEIPMFWVDLTTANGMNLNLVEGSFSGAEATGAAPNNSYSGTAINNWFPQAKIGNGNFVYAYSGTQGSNYYWFQNGVNYFGLATMSSFSGACGNIFGTGLTVRQAYNIDRKIDDGLPQTGNVIALYLYSFGGGIQFAGTGSGAWGYGINNTNPQSGSPTTCFDNGGASGATQQYSLEQNNGTGVNCALSFQMQGAGR